MHDNFPIDRVIADPEMNEQFQTTCTRLGLNGSAFERNHRLLHLRKAGRLKRLSSPARTVFPSEEQSFDRYKFACEIALERFERENRAVLDDVLCNPELARGFDDYVLSMLPDARSALQIRWFALCIRKSAVNIRKASARVTDVVKLKRYAENPFELKLGSVPSKPGIYWLASDKHLYIGETLNLRERLEIQFGHRKFDFGRRRSLSFG